MGGPPGSADSPAKPFLWTITAPANGAKSTYTGVELSWQHFLENGLGTHVQYTHTWSKGYDQFGNPTGAVNAAPPTTFSISLIYDKGPFNADVNWDYTSRYTSYCSTCTEVPGWPAIADSVLLGDGERALPAFQGLRGVRRRQEPHQRHRAYLPQRQSACCPGRPGQLVGAERQRRGSGLQRLRPQLRSSASRTASDVKKPWLIYALITTGFWGVWGAFAEFPTPARISGHAGVRGVGADHDSAGAVRNAAGGLAGAARSASPCCSDR